MYEMSRVAENLSIWNCVNSTVYLVHKCWECQDLQKIWKSRTSKIHREIAYIMYVRNVWICKKIEYPELRKLNWKLCTLYARNVWISRKIEYPLLHIFNGRLCTLYMYEMSRFAEKFEYPELRKFNGKLCTLYMYGMSGFIEKLIIQNWKNSTRNCFHYICTECLDLQKNWISRTAKIQREIVYIIYVREVLFWRKIEYLELRKFVGKLCTLYIYGTSWFQKIWLPGTVKIQLEIVYTIYVRNVKICREIEFPEPSNLNGKLYT